MIARTHDGYALPVFRARGGGLTLKAEEATSTNPYQGRVGEQVFIAVFSKYEAAYGYSTAMRDVGAEARHFQINPDLYASLVWAAPMPLTVAGGDWSAGRIVLLDRRETE